MRFDKNIRVYLTRKGKLQNGNRNRNVQNLRHNHNYEKQKKREETRRTKKRLKE